MTDNAKPPFPLLHTPGPYVRREGNQLVLQFVPGVIQSQMRLDAPEQLSLGYTRTLMGFLLFMPAPQRITMIGLGGGSLPKYCHARLPETQIAVVEICAEVIALRETFLIPPDGPDFHIHCADGAEYVAGLDGSEDVIIVDGFDPAGQAASLCTEGFYRDCHRALSDRGVLAVNLSDNHKQHAALIRRLRKVFDDAVFVVTAEDCSNRIVFALRDGSVLAGSANPFSLKSLLKQAAQLERQHPLAFRQIVERMTTNRLNPL